MSLDHQLKPLREKIDELDRNLVRLLKERAVLAEQVGEIKRIHQVPFHRPDRHHMVLEKVGRQADEVLSKRALESIYAEIISACLAKEMGLTIAFLGPKATYSEEAAHAQFGSSAQLMSCVSIDDVFFSVQSKRADVGLVPVENTTEGAVGRTLDLLLTSDVLIQGEISMPIRHQLLSNEEALDQIETVCAHPQALGQCRQWLQINLPHATWIEASSNAKAAEIAQHTPKMAAIASDRAAMIYQLGYLARNIQDEANNRTRFAELGYLAPVPTGRDQTSIILSTQNKAGALYHLIEPFQTHGVSMTRFESRPAKNGAWEYFFYVDIEGHQQDQGVSLVLKDLEKQASFFKVLGSYPKRMLG
jgi:chorismate mutase/prephenate dehydratase